MIRRPVVIVGAGPAGMSAAITVAEAGLSATVLDENQRPGGQIYRQPPPGIQVDQGTSSNHGRGQALRERFERCRERIEFLGGTNVWGIFPERRLAISQGQGWQMIEAEHLILAAGAYEYTPPFPGWTLPGVLTPGGAQAMVKTMGVLPGRRIVVAGSGPFLLVVAWQLHSAGAKVTAVVELARRRDVLTRLPGLMSDPPLLLEGWRHLRRLRRAGIPLMWGHVVTEARGTDELHEVLIAPCDALGTPDRQRSRVVQADALAAGYGFVPRTDLAQLAGCQLKFVADWGGWVPEADETGLTSAEGVWVAGDGAGVAGALAAEWQGTLAGLAVARRLGSLDLVQHEALRQPVLRKLARLRRFRCALDAIYPIRPGLSRLANEDTLVCRCEELTRREVETGIGFGGHDPRTLKVMTRLGMGPCQGRMCWPAAARLIAERTGRSLEAIGPASCRPPLRPLLVGDLADEPALAVGANAHGSPLDGGGA